MRVVVVELGDVVHALAFEFGAAIRELGGVVNRALGTTLAL